MTSRVARAAGAVLLVAAALAGPASADEIEVKMLNTDGKGKFMVFQPEFIKAKVGDTVKFVPTAKGHNAEMVPDLWPEGAGEFVGDMNQEAVITVEKPGIYGIKCKPHYPMGMLAFIVVGDDLPNKGQLETYKPPATAEKRYNALKEQVGGK